MKQERFVATLTPEFFGGLLPFNARLLKGNAMVVRACGAKPQDGSVLQSKEFLLFQHGLATLVMWPQHPLSSDDSGIYTAIITKKEDARGVTYWEIGCATGQPPPATWTLEVASSPPEGRGENSIRILVQKGGKPGQYLFLRRTAP